MKNIKILSILIVIGFVLTMTVGTSAAKVSLVDLSKKTDIKTTIKTQTASVANIQSLEQNQLNAPEVNTVAGNVAAAAVTTTQQQSGANNAAVKITQT